MLRRSRQSFWLGCALAAILVAAASLLRWMLVRQFGDLPLFITFYPAVALVAMFHGARAGVVATSLSAVAADVFFMEPFGAFVFVNANQVVALALFTAAGALISAMAIVMDRARQQAAEADARRQSAEKLAAAAAETEKQRQLLAVTLASIGDAVIVTDVQGQVSFLNGEAEHLTGWTAADATGRPLPMVFHIINEQTREPVESPVDKVLRLGTVVGLANHTILIAKNGREIPIDDSGAPIRHGDGVVHGVVLVFRDFSERKAAERALRESEERLRSFVENAPVALAMFDRAMRYVSVSLRWLTDFALAGRDLRGLSHYDVFPEIPGRWKEIHRRALAGEVVRADEDRFERADGSVQWLRWEVRPWHDAAGVAGIVVLSEDITLRKRADFEREGAVALLRLINDSRNTNDLIHAATEFFRKTSGCEAIGIRVRSGEDFPYYETRGFPMEFVLLENSLCARDALGSLVRDAGGNPVIECMCGNVICGRFDPSKRFFTARGSFWTNSTTELLASTTDADRQTRTRNRCNGEGYESVALIPLRVGQERLGLLQINDKRKGRFSEDLLAFWERLADYLAVALSRFAAADSLRESEFFHRQTLESIPGMVFTTRPDGYCDYQSQQWVDFTGVPMKEHLGDGWNKLLHPDDRPRAFAAWQAAVNGRAPYDVQYRVRRHDGEYEWFQVRGHPIRDTDGKIVRWFGVAANIEDLKRAESALDAARTSAESAKADAEAASKAKDHFLAVLSHELRTPLTPIVPALSMLADSPGLDDAARKTLDMVRRNVDLETRLIDDLLDVTRIAKSKVELDRKPIQICEVIRQAVEVCQPDIEARRLDFGVDLKDAPYVVDGDPARLQQVFWNLLKNAVKFTPPGGCVGVRGRRVDGHAVIEVNDSGLGIEPDALARIFDAFEQAEQSIKRQFGGLGLGLTISKALVEMHGGSISANSGGRGKGATFTVRLPLARSERGISSNSPVTAKPAQAKSRALRILLVEDHGDTAKVLRALLQRDGHHVEHAGDVATALGMAASTTFDLLISDLGLPDESGLGLIRELRRRGQQMPGIALSGYGQEEDIRRSREAGFALHLIKPTSPQRLAESIASLVDDAPAAP